MLKKWMLFCQNGHMPKFWQHNDTDRERRLLGDRGILSKLLSNASDYCGAREIAPLLVVTRRCGKGLFARMGFQK